MGPLGPPPLQEQFIPSPSPTRKSCVLPIFNQKKEKETKKKKKNEKKRERKPNLIERLRDGEIERHRFFGYRHFLS